MDGWGHGSDPKRSAIAQANTSFVDSLYTNYPNAELTTFGEQVGLPKGQMGNSEVGHLNIGAGRIVFQELLKINNSISNGDFFENEVLLKAFGRAKSKNVPVHFVGLVSSGGVHSHIDHLKALIDLGEQLDVPEMLVHTFTDGRDSDPHSGLKHLQALLEFIDNKDVALASIIGRYYAMDRDKRWPRVKLAYDLLVNGKGLKSENALQSVENQYNENITDEFLKPIVLTDKNGYPRGKINEGDVVICFNFRTDRCRQISTVLTQEAFPEFDMKPINIDFITMTRYDEDFKNVGVIFENKNLQNTLGEILEKHSKSQIRIAETEKYPHVTYFFNGGREEAFKLEKRILAPSPKVATYDLQPEMSALEITEKLLLEVENETADFICLNFANTDMVGHTGVFQAAVKAAETVDACVERITTQALKSNYSILLTADHGNADCMINENGTPNTAHTKNPVPLIYISHEKLKSVRDGKLGDLAPTILKLMGIDIPIEMTGENLIADA